LVASRNIHQTYHFGRIILQKRVYTNLATAATGIAGAMQTLESLLQSNTTPEFKSLVTDMILKFAGERPEEKDVKSLINQPLQTTTLSPKN
jgi:hypothetical protein